MVDDAALLEGWRNGDKDAGEQLFERYFDPISRFFANKVSGDPDDLVQETFMACVRGRDRVREGSSFRAYMYGVACNVLRGYIRKKQAGSASASFDSCSAHDLAPGPSTMLYRREEERLLVEALRRIPMDLQMILELHYWETMTTNDIAEVLELPVGTVRSRMRRARERLHDVIAELSTEQAMTDSTLGGLDGWAAQVRDLALSPS
ncbi:MAG: sigma-70 family RNA polymerase sigma factor [Myxococcota bacterium]